MRPERTKLKQENTTKSSLNLIYLIIKKTKMKNVLFRSSLFLLLVLQYGCDNSKKMPSDTVLKDLIEKDFHKPGNYAGCDIISIDILQKGKYILVGKENILPVKAEIKYTGQYQSQTQNHDWIEVYHIMVDEQGNYQVK